MPPVGQVCSLRLLSFEMRSCVVGYINNNVPSKSSSSISGIFSTLKMGAAGSSSVKFIPDYTVSHPRRLDSGRIKVVRIGYSSDFW